MTINYVYLVSHIYTLYWFILYIVYILLFLNAHASSKKLLVSINRADIFLFLSKGRETRIVIALVSKRVKLQSALSKPELSIVCLWWEQNDADRFCNVYFYPPALTPDAASTVGSAQIMAFRDTIGMMRMQLHRNPARNSWARWIRKHNFVALADAV